MLIVRWSLLILGVGSALLFQAWALPFFIIAVVVIGLFFVPKNWRQKGQPHKSDLVLNTYIVFLFFCYALLFIMIIEPEWAQYILKFWDKLSVHQLSLPEGEPIRLHFFNPNSSKLLMNLTALVTPIIIAKHYPYILQNTYPQRSLGWTIYIILLVLFILVSLLPLIVFPKINPSYRELLALLFYVYFFQVSFVSLFIRFKP